tara:strand:+ start:124137 stop:124976 length:840 start_codon:yes stop_codon:yes gene_type:complete
MKSLFSLIIVLIMSFIPHSQGFILPELPTDNGDGFIVIAHRGASAYAPENTLSSFRLAVEMKAEMMELDVSLSKDGIPVVIHDETVNRTTDANGAVSDFTVDELKVLETGAWFSEDFAGEPFPTLKEVLSEVKGEIAVNIEIKSEAVKNTAEGGIVEKCLQIVRTLGIEKNIIFSSFDYRVMDHLNELAPDLPKAILYEESQSGNLLPSELVKKYKVDAFNFSHRQFSQEWEDDLKVHGIPFFIYTVNEEKLMKELIERGATGIFSDKPDVLKSVVENL